MKYIAALLLAAGLVIGCTTVPDSERADNARVQDQQSHYATVQPIPYFDFSMDRDILIQIYKAKNESRLTYSVVTSMTGAVLFICPSIGYGIPADTQLTNGLQAYGGSYGYTSIEQAEPNGLFSSKNTNATYVLCVRDDGTVNVVQSEQTVTTFPFPVTVDASGRVVDAGGESTVKIEVKEGVEGVAPPPSAAP